MFGLKNVCNPVTTSLWLCLDVDSQLLVCIQMVSGERVGRERGVVNGWFSFYFLFLHDPGLRDL